MTTTINRNNIADIRAVLDTALADTLKKLGLKHHLGRITYEPGQEFRVKLTVIQPKDTTAGPVPIKVGQTYSLYGKTYTIHKVEGGTVHLYRPTRGRRYQLLGGRRVKMYTIPLARFNGNAVAV